jgi:phospholipase/carboxylesterase
MHQHTKNIRLAGTSLQEASKAMIMVHGRGATSEGILSLSDHLKVKGFALLAPQANQRTWYPFSFMAPKEDNEPGLSTGLEVLKEIVEDVKAAGIDAENIYFLGFSQGACLMSEFVARNAERFGGVFILSGGLIGKNLDTSNYSGDFEGTPIFLGCSDVDPHIPLARVEESVEIFKEMGAKMTVKLYPNGPHTIYEDEIKEVNGILKQ